MNKAEGTRQKAEVRNLLTLAIDLLEKDGSRQRVPHFCLVPSALCLLKVS